MKLYPAIDLRGGQAVRLYQGDYDQMTVYNPAPVAQAKDFAAAGAKYLHVVDLDGAKEAPWPTLTPSPPLPDRVASTSRWAAESGTRTASAGTWIWVWAGASWAPSR